MPNLELSLKVVGTGAPKIHNLVKFAVFCPTRATVYTAQDEIWHGTAHQWHQKFTLACQIRPLWVKGVSMWVLKNQNLANLHQGRRLHQSPREVWRKKHTAGSLSCAKHQFDQWRTLGMGHLRGFKIGQIWDASIHVKIDVEEHTIVAALRAKSLPRLVKGHGHGSPKKKILDVWLSCQFCNDSGMLTISSCYLLLL